MNKRERMNIFDSFFSIFPEDRSGYFKANELDVSYEHPIPKFDKDFSLTLDDCMNLRAKELKKETRKIYLMYSGGIDSTAVFYALIENDINFSIIMNENSFHENPILGKELKEGKFKHIEIVDWNFLRYNNKEETLLLTGEIGDQLFGSVILLHHNFIERKTNYKDILKYKKIANIFGPSLEKLLNRTDFTLDVFLWGMNFIYKYTDVLKRMKAKSKLFENQNLLHFYDTLYFQQWSLHNYENNLNFSEITDYKKPLKLYIFKYNNDIMYLKYKTKIPSLQLKGFEDG